MKNYSGLETFQSQQVMYEILGKQSICYKKAEKIFIFPGHIPKRSIYRHRRVYKNYQSIKCANATIPAKGPAYFRRVSCGYVERSPLHFVLWLELPPSSKTWRATGLDVSQGYGVRRRETTPSLAALWLGRKNKGFLAPIRSQNYPDRSELVR